MCCIVRAGDLYALSPILLGQTDPVSPPPHLEIDFRVTCDDCGKEYKYSPRQILRYETKPAASFIPHPLFTDSDSAPITQQAGGSAPSFARSASSEHTFSQIVRHLFHRAHRSYL
jgi:hypothetical protein